MLIRQRTWVRMWRRRWVWEPSEFEAYLAWFHCRCDWDFPLLCQQSWVWWRGLVRFLQYSFFIWIRGRFCLAVPLWGMYCRIRHANWWGFLNWEELAIIAMRVEWDVVEEERLCRTINFCRIFGTSMGTNMFGVIFVVTKGCHGSQKNHGLNIWR